MSEAAAKAFYLPSLDGLRALSIAVVVVAHAGWDHIIPGGFGVTVFFFLSGFLITTLLRKEWQETQCIDWRAFYVRRAFRILPPFYLVWAVATFLCWMGFIDGTLQWRAVLSQALHVGNYWLVGHSYVGMAQGTYVYWSLAVEEHFYAVFPWMMLAVYRLGWSHRKAAGLLAGLCVASLGWRSWLVFVEGAPMLRTYVASDTRFESIAWGALLALWKNPALGDLTPRQAERFWRWGLPLGLLALLAGFLVRDPGFRETGRYSLQGLGLLPVFVCALAFPHRGVFAALQWPWMIALGRWSYALYLVHHAVIFAVARYFPQWNPLSALALTVSLSVGLAWLLHNGVELPMSRLRAKWMAQDALPKSVKIQA